MSPYQELQKSAENNRREWVNLEERMTTTLFKIVQNLVVYCQIPDRTMMYSRWNGEPAIDGKMSYDREGGGLTIPGAIRFNPDDGFWRLGVRIALSKNVLPQLGSFFVLAITERKGKTILLAPPDGHELEIDPNDSQQLNALSKAIVESIKRRFDSEPLSYLNLKSDRKSIGFSVSIDESTSNTLEVDI